MYSIVKHWQSLCRGLGGGGGRWWGLGGRVGDQGTGGGVMGSADAVRRLLARAKELSVDDLAELARLKREAACR